MLNRLHQEPDLVFGEINFHEPSLSHGSNVRLGFVWYRWSRGGRLYPGSGFAGNGALKTCKKMQEKARPSTIVHSTHVTY
jgi:hypothetical protein